MRPDKAGVFRGIKPSRVKVGSPLAWVAVVEEMKPLKPTDKIFYRKIASYQAVMKMNLHVASLNSTEDADPVDTRGRPMSQAGRTEAACVIFRGSRVGMLRMIFKPSAGDPLW